jgi:hypothetical protein
MYSYTLSLTLVLDGVGSGPRDAPAAVPRHRESVPLVQEMRTTKYVHNINVTVVTAPKLGGTKYLKSLSHSFEIPQTRIIPVVNQIRTLSRFQWAFAEKAAYGKGCLVFRVC